MWPKEKLVSVFVLFGLPFISGVLACVTVKCLVKKFGKSKRFQSTIGMLNCFAGGVFFATCILGIIPEARELMEEAKENWGWSSEYPLSELCVGIGFFMILCLEHGVHICLRQDDKSNDTTGKKNSYTLSEDQSITKSTSEFSQKQTQINHNHADHVKNDKGGLSHENGSYLHDATYQSNCTVDQSLDKTSVRPNTTSCDLRDKEVDITIIESNDKIVVRQDQVVSQTEAITTTEALQSLATTSEEPARANLRGLVLLLALSFHMVFEGLALGLMKDASGVWDLLLALCLHKVLVFFTIGLQTLELVKSLRKTVFFIFILSLISPIGVIIGESIISQGNESTQDSVAAIMQGISAGTFLFVTFFEIFQRELGMGKHNLIKVFVSILGFALVGATRLLGHGHH